jgi:hypothetical protein
MFHRNLKLVNNKSTYSFYYRRKINLLRNLGDLTDLGAKMAPKTHICQISSVTLSPDHKSSVEGSNIGSLEPGDEGASSWPKRIKFRELQKL